MRDFDSLVGEVLKQRPDLTRTELLRMIEEKKRLVGAGYLTDQGALFLVAGELGLELKRDDSSELALKDLYIGANDTTVVARILAIYPTSSYVSKEGREGTYRRLILFDKSVTTRLTVWEDAEVVERLGLVVDAPVRVVSAYVKQGLDGKPTLNLGRKGKIELLNDENLVSSMPSISEFERDIADVSEASVIAVRGVVQSDSKSSEFTRSDGSGGTLTHFVLKSERGDKEQRVVIWNGSNLPSLKGGERVRVTNLRLREQRYGEPELHGDSGSRIEGIQPKFGSTLLLVVSSPSLRSSNEFLVADAKRNFFRLNLKGDAAESAGDLTEGDVIEVLKSEKYEDAIVCTTSDSVKRVSLKPDSLPSFQSLFIKVKDIETASGPILLEVIALSKGSVQDVRLKDGSFVRKGELLIGDDTGEIRVAAWRETSDKVDGIQEGERLQIIGATVQKSRMNTPIVQITRLSKVKHLKRTSLDDNLRL